MVVENYGLWLNSFFIAIAICLVAYFLGQIDEKLKRIADALEKRNEKD